MEIKLRGLQKIRGLEEIRRAGFVRQTIGGEENFARSAKIFFWLPPMVETSGGEGGKRGKRQKFLFRLNMLL